MFGEEQYLAMKESAYFINVCRGPVQDEKALTEALRKGWIQGAGIDVFEEEPVPPGHPLLELDNVVLTPHTGWITVEASERLVRMTIDNVFNYGEGHPTSVVNPEVL